ncbi:MAG TPA: hypothetical protein VEQ59_05035, partial [Polyangiaceae bacterium]|nr:hypothetical protein [Polyangiaceae bacterium]
TAAALKAYFGERRFKLITKDPSTLRAELGAEAYVFTFEKPDEGVPRCATAYSASGVSWQEVTARLTGVAPEKLKLNQPVKTVNGDLELRVEHETDQPTIRLCRGAPP